MDKELKEIIIASWLHDVGKFAQRAGRTEFYNKELEGQYCKVQQGGWYGYQHVIYTLGFLEKFRNILPDELDAIKITHLAAKHHSPSTYEEWLIAQGDRLSSGSDRCNILGEEDAENESLQNDNPKFFEKPLIHILSTLKIGERREAERAYCKMLPLDEDAILSTSSSKIGQEDYNRLWELFEKDFVELKYLTFEQFMPALDSLLERYWWCIPSATNSDADISLYQHAKTTAAFASALYAFQKDCNKESEVELGNRAEKKFLFLKGDVSGIQKYIFELKTNDDSSKLLRAKSFQIAALGDIIARNIVSQAGVSEANIITSAGGNFMLLFPNTEKIKQLLPLIQLETETYFLNEFAGKLSVIISDGVEASLDDVQQENAQRLINAIGHNADLCKQKKMQKVLQKNGAVLTEFYDNLQKFGECPKCGIFASSGTNEDGTPKECANCSALTDLGSRLVKSSWLKFKSEKLLPFGQMVQILKDNKKSEKTFASINDYIPGRAVVHLPYTAPRNEDGNLLCFSDIAKKSTGNNKLAMFKADIDNLGLVFSSSLEKRMSFSRYADMSHKMHYFFSAYYTYFVNSHTCIMKDKNGTECNVLYKDVIYTVFSGGDDLCILGSWNAVIQFALDFQKELVKLTNNNQSLTLSAGIALSGAGVPVAMIAENAEALLEKSKERKDETKTKTVKNAITVFGTTVSWKEFEKCVEDGKLLQKYLEDAALSTGVVYKMIDFANRAERVLGGNVKDLLNMRNQTWKSNFKYIVARNVNDEKIRDWLLAFGTSPQEMIKSRIAVSYALYTQRKN
jgi:CRISPR-associated protein Csm1